MARAPRRGKPKDSGRKVKKKISVLSSESIDYVDWKDVDLLRKFVSERAKIRARRVTGNSIQQQREVALAVKNAREMALLPYTNRVTTNRAPRDREGGREGGREGREGGRGDRPDRDSRSNSEEAFTSVDEGVEINIVEDGGGVDVTVEDDR